MAKTKVISAMMVLLMAVKNKSLVVKPSIKNAEITIINPLAIKKAVVNHCASDCVMEKASRWGGVASNISFVDPINAPGSTTLSHRFYSAILKLVANVVTQPL